MLHGHLHVKNKVRTSIGQPVLLLWFVCCGIMSGCSSQSPNVPKNPAQNVFIFIAGMNTSLNSACVDGTFDKLINNYLVSKLGVSDPYAQGCNAKGQNYLDANSSIAYFSYTGGKMDTQHGVWLPRSYNGCDADNTRLADDITNFENMLKSYESLYPRAVFTIVGHSLGGLVGLQGGYYDYAQHKGHTRISKVITIDSPLEGLFIVPQKQSWIDWSTRHCSNLIPSSGWVVPDDLVPLGKVSFVSPLCTATQGQPTIKPPVTLSQCAARALTKAGVGVYTLGNSQDSLFCDTTWKPLVSIQLFEYTCQTQELISEPSTFMHLYDLSDHSAVAAGHGIVLVTDAAEQDIVRYILAPVILVRKPQAGETQWFNGVGTPVHFSATVRCLWGLANHAEAVVQPTNRAPLSNGVTTARASSFTLDLTGTATIPAAVVSDSATFYVKAGGSACNYPAKLDASMIPQDSDYLFGATQGIPIALDGGKLALGLNGHLYARRPTSDFFNGPSLDYSRSNQQGTSNSIVDIAWSHDGTQLAYLVNNPGEVANGNPAADLSVASTTLMQPKTVAKDLVNAVALTWNSGNDKIAVLEETPSQSSLSFNFVPSIAIINANTGTIVQQINLPASSAMSSFFCEIVCGRGRSRIQWGASGVFLIGNGEVGSALVTAAGQITPLPTPSGSNSPTIFSPDMAQVGALNAQGTLVAYPTQDYNTRNASISLYQVDPSTGKLGSPSTLVAFPQGSFTLGTTADFSPDGTKVALCADKGVFTADIHQPGTSQTVLKLPGNFDNLTATQHSFTCENLRWSADGTAILVQLVGSPETEYDIFVGQALLFLDGSEPQVLAGCGVTATSSGLQFSGVYDQSCTYAPAAFDWQPMHS
jgi:hypothetical protein